MFKQILNTFFTRIISGVLNLIIAIVISKFLGADGKGVQGIILTTISILVVFSGIIGPGGLTYLLPRMAFSLLIIPSYLWTLVLTLLMWIILHLIHIVPDQYIIHVILIAFLASVSSLNNAILHSKKLIQQVNLINISQIIVSLVVIIYLIIYKHLLNVNSYIVGLYVGFSTSVSLSFIFTRKYYKNSTYKISINKYAAGVKNLFKYGGYNQLDIFAQLISFRLAYYVLNFYTTTAQVGIYSNAVSLIEAVWIISRSISFVQHSRIVNSRDKFYKDNLTLRFVKLAGSMAFIAIVVLVMIPSGFYKFVFGEEFGAIRVAIIALSPGVLFFSISFVLSAYFSGIGKHFINSLSSIAGLIIITVLAFVLIPNSGIIGAGIAASVSYFSTTVIKVLFFTKETKFGVKLFFPNKEDWYELKELFRLMKQN